MGIIDTTSTVAKGLAHFAASASEVLPNAAPNAPLEIDPSEKGGKITQKLIDLRVPPSLKDWLTTALGSLAFTIETVEIPGRFNSPKRSYDVIRNVAGQRSIFHIAKEILEDGSNWEAVGGVISVLRLKNQVLIVVSEGLEAPSVAYSSFGGPVWLEDSGIRWAFIPWRNLQEVMPLPADEQRVYLPNLFQLEDLLREARERPAVDKPALDVTAEVAKIGNILGQLPVFVDNGEAGWRVFMNQAGLEALVGSLNLTGSTTTIIAINVITQLKDRKPLADRPGEQVLGRFLRQVLKISDLKPVDGDKIREIINTYNL